MSIPRLRGKQLSALRAVAGAPAGLWLGAFPSQMPRLVAMGLIEERTSSRVSYPTGRAWFTTAEGRVAVRAYGLDDA